MSPNNIRSEHLTLRPFHAITSIEFAKENILTGASFIASPVPALPPQPPLPLLQKGIDRVIEIILREGKS